MALAERVRDIAVDAVARGGGKQHGEQGGGGSSSSSSSNGGKTVATEVDRDVSLSGDGGGGGGGEVVVTRSPDSSGSGHVVGRGGGGSSSNRGTESTSEVSRGHTIDADDVEAAEAAAVYGAATGDARGMKMVKSGLWIAPKRIIVGRKIASGGFGAVRLGRLESAEVDARVGGGDVAMAQPATSRSTVVLKAIFAQIIEERDVAEFWHEAAMLAQIDHPHVIGFHGVTKKPVGGHLRSETSMQVGASTTFVYFLFSLSLSQVCVVLCQHHLYMCSLSLSLSLFLSSLLCRLLAVRFPSRTTSVLFISFPLQSTVAHLNPPSPPSLPPCSS